MFDDEPRNDAGRLLADANLIVSFMNEAVIDKQATEETGIQTFKDEVYLHIQIPADKDLVIHRPADKQDKARFFKEYEAFIAGTKGTVKGYPVKEWSQITASQVKTLLGLNIHTVETLASLPDSQAMKYSLSGLKARAKIFLEAQADEAAVMKQAMALEARDEEIRLLNEKIDQILRAQLNTKTEETATAEPKKVGRPAKSE